METNKAHRKPGRWSGRGPGDCGGASEQVGAGRPGGQDGASRSGGVGGAGRVRDHQGGAGRAGRAEDHHGDAGGTFTESKARLVTASVAMTKPAECSETASMPMTGQAESSEMTSMAVTGQAESSGMVATSSGGSVTFSAASGEACTQEDLVQELEIHA